MKPSWVLCNFFIRMIDILLFFSYLYVPSNWMMERGRIEGFRESLFL